MRARLLAGVALAVLTLAAASPAAAQDATWNLNGSGDFNTATNWSPATVPTGTASFGTSNQNNVSFSADTTIGGWTFNAGASNYIFTNGQILRLTGAGIVINGGSATITNNGSLRFSGSSTAGSATIINNIELEFLSFSTAGSATINNNNGGSLRFLSFSTAGGATITNNSGGLLLFGSSGTAGGATITNNSGGLLQFGSFSTAGSATIANNGGLEFFGSSAAGSATISNNNGGTTFFQETSSGGTARLIANAGGAVDFSGLASAGTTAGSFEGSGNFFLGSKTITVGGNNLSAEVSGVIQDGGGSGGVGGSLTKVGTGTLTLTGVSTYTGDTNVDAGTLLVNGSIASSSSVFVNPGATLGGTGTVAATLLDNNATLAPGTPTQIGTLTVNDALLFCDCSLYAVKVSSSASDLTQVGSLGVPGVALIDGTVLVSSPTQTYRFNSPYTILTTPGGVVIGTFSGLSLPTGLAGSLSYTATDVLLSLTSNLGQVGGFKQNQQAVANALDLALNAPGTASGPFGALFGLSPAGIANALTLLSGEAATGAQQGVFQLGSQFLLMMLDPFTRNGGLGGTGFAAGGALPLVSEAPPPPEIALAYAKILKAPPAPGASLVPDVPERRWSAWGGAYGGASRTRGDAVMVGSHDLTARTGGYAAGVDYRLAPGTVAGFALAGGFTNWGLANGLGGGNGDAFQAGVYGATRFGPAYLAAAASIAEHWMQTDRTAFLGDRLTARFDAQSYGARVEGGWRFATFMGGITPYAAVQAQRFRTPAYSETDATGGGFALAYHRRNASDTRSELGARFDRLIPISSLGLLALHARAAFAHDWVSDPTLAALF